MCSHEKITWKNRGNSVIGRMIDNSLEHKFITSSRIRKRTKILNTELRNHGRVRNYKQYVSFKTTLLRNLAEDSYTDHIDNLSDVDYNVIYSTPLTQAKYIAKSFNKFNILSGEEDSEAYKRKMGKHTNKSLKPKCNTKKPSKPQSTSKKYINIGWRDIIKKNKKTSHFFNNATQANISNDEENFFKDGEHDYLETQSSKRLLVSKNSKVFDIMKSESEQTKQNDENSNVVVDELSSQSDAVFNKTKSIVENGPQNYEVQSASLNKSNIELKSQNSHDKIDLSKSTNLENNNSHNSHESNILKMEDSFNNELTETNEELKNTKTYNNIHVNHKSLKNVRKNLTSVLEKIDSTNKKNIKKNESTKAELNCDQSLSATVSFNQSNIQSSTPLKKIQIDVINTQNSLPSALLLNQQKYFKSDEHLENKLVENEQFNRKSPTSFLADIAEEILTSPRKSKKIIMQKEIKTIELENSKQDMNEMHPKYCDNDLEDNGKQDNEEEKLPEEIKNSSRLNQIDNLMTSETDNEEDNINYLSPQSKKRLHQQATLNLVVYSESSDSDDEKNMSIKSVRKRIDSSDTSLSYEDNTFKNDESTCTSKKTDIDGSCSKVSYEDTHISSEEITPVSEEIAKSNSIVVQRRMKKKTKDRTMSITKSTCENNLLKSNSNKNPLRETQNCENVYNDEFSLLDKENIYNESNQRYKEIKIDEFDGNKSRCKQSSTSMRNSHVESHASSCYRPYNIQQLVEDENLVIETLPASFTLEDLSDDVEAFILNVPSKLLESNLEGQMLTITDKIIKFGQNKYKISHKEMDTIPCVFATGKKEKPYKTVNIKNVSIITAGERLSRHTRKSNSLNLNNTDTSSELNPSKISNRKINETESKISKKYNKRKQRRNSDSKSEQSVTKRKRLKVHS